MVDPAEKRAASHVLEQRYLILATSNDNVPWIAPVAYAETDTLSLIFSSRPSSRHGRTIGHGEVFVAVAIFDGALPSLSADGIQLEGTCRRLADEDLTVGGNTFWTRLHVKGETAPAPIDPLERWGSHSQRGLYVITPHRIFVTDLARYLETGLDYREKVDISIVGQLIREHWRSHPAI